MMMQASEEQANSNHAKPPADIEDFRLIIESTSSEFRGAPGMSENVVNEHDYRPLLRAAIKGDWKSAQIIFEQDPASKTAKITSRFETVLHIAALSAQDQFVEDLIELLSPSLEALEMVDCDGRTVLHNAVLCGSIRMVKALVESNPNLTQLPDNEGNVPLKISAQESNMHEEIARFLAKETTNNSPSRPFSSPSLIEAIINLTYAGHYEIALDIVGQDPNLIKMRRGKHGGMSILSMLARKEVDFLSGARFSVLEALIYRYIPVDLKYKLTDENSRNMQTSTDPAIRYLTRLLWCAVKNLVPIIKRIHKVKLRHTRALELAEQVCIEISNMKTTEIAEFFEEIDLLGQATARGINELMKLCIQYFPELFWITPYGRKSRMLAVLHRQEGILKLFLKVSSTNELSLVPAPTQQESKAMILAAARYKNNVYAIRNVYGSAHEMQRELQWFKTIELLIALDERIAQSGERTIAPWEERSIAHSKESSIWKIFVEEHKELLGQGEKWMKDTTDKCMLVSALIATVLFAAAFTVPGGNDNNTGVPLMLGKDSFLIFAISDALGLLCSVMAILIFLAILTSRYELRDFLDSLPKRIIMGLSFLFLSLTFMLVAFAATLTIVLDKRINWVYIPIAVLTSLPVASYAILQHLLLFKLVKSTYGRGIFHLEEHFWG